MNIVCLKMSNGDELIARHAGGTVYSHVMHVFVQQGKDGRMGMGMIPWVHSMAGDELSIPDQHIVCSVDVDPEIEKNYLQRTSGIALS